MPKKRTRSKSIMEKRKNEIERTIAETQTISSSANNQPKSSFDLNPDAEVFNPRKMEKRKNEIERTIAETQTISSSANIQPKSSFDLNPDAEVFKPDEFKHIIKKPQTLNPHAEVFSPRKCINFNEVDHNIGKVIKWMDNNKDEFEHTIAETQTISSSANNQPKSSFDLNPHAKMS